MTYTCGSLFSGIGGLDMAAAAVGFDVRFQVEIDAYCRRVLTARKRYWPNAIIHEDVRRVGKRELETVDCLFGGFPCQDISVGGKRAGITRDTRSGLWFEFARLIGELRPRVVFLENVDDIVSLGGDIVTADLAALGYDAIWLTLFASDVGAPHIRERWFCVAYPSGDRRGTPAGIHRQPQPDPDEEWHAAPSQQTGNAVANSTIRSREAVGDSHSFNTAQKRPLRRQSPSFRRSKGTSQRTGHRGRQRHVHQPRVAADADGLSDRLAGHRYPAGQGAPQHPYEPPRTFHKPSKDWKAAVQACGNAVVPQVVYPFFLAIHQWLSYSEKEMK